MPSLNEVARSIDVLTANARSVMSGLTEWATSTDDNVNIKVAVPMTSATNSSIRYIGATNAQIPTLNGISAYIDGTPMDDGEVGECWIDKKIFLASAQPTSGKFSSSHRPGWVFDAFNGSAPTSAVKSNGRWTSNGSLIYTDRKFLSSDYMYNGDMSTVTGAILSSNVRSYFYDGLFIGSSSAADGGLYDLNAQYLYSQYIPATHSTSATYIGSTPFIYASSDNGGFEVLFNDCSTLFVLDNANTGSVFSVFAKDYQVTYGAASGGHMPAATDTDGHPFFTGTVRVGSDGVNGGTTVKNTYIDGCNIFIGNGSAITGIYPGSKTVSIGSPVCSGYSTTVSLSGNSFTANTTNTTLNSTMAYILATNTIVMSANNNISVRTTSLNTTTSSNTTTLTPATGHGSILSLSPSNILQRPGSLLIPVNAVRITPDSGAIYPNTFSVNGFSSVYVSSDSDSMYYFNGTLTDDQSEYVTDIIHDTIHQYIGAKTAPQYLDVSNQGYGAGISVRSSGKILETASYSSGTGSRYSTISNQYSKLSVGNFHTSSNANIDKWCSSTYSTSDGYYTSYNDGISASSFSGCGSIFTLALSSAAVGSTPSTSLTSSVDSSTGLSILTTNPGSGLSVNINSDYSAFYGDKLVNMTLNNPWSVPSYNSMSNAYNTSLVISNTDSNPVSATLPNGFGGIYAALSAFGETKSTLGTGTGTIICSGSSYVAVSSSEAVIGSTDGANVCGSYLKVVGSGTEVHGGLEVEGGSIQAMGGLQVTGGDTTIGEDGDHRNLIVYGSMSATDGIAPTCVISSKTDFITNHVSDWANLGSNSLSAVCDVADPSNNYGFAGQSGGIRNIIMRITLPVPSDPAMSATWLISSTIIHIAEFSAGISTYPVNAFYRIESAYDHDDNAHEGYLPFNSSFSNTADGMSVIITSSGSTTCGPKAFVVNKNVLGSWNIYVNAYINLGSNPPAGSGDTTIAVRGTMSAILVNPTVQTNGI